jgi:hypothetical protein
VIDAVEERIDRGELGAATGDVDRCGSYKAAKSTRIARDPLGLPPTMSGNATPWTTARSRKRSVRRQNLPDNLALDLREDFGPSKLNFRLPTDGAAGVVARWFCV